jgi:hypothetical protein
MLPAPWVVQPSTRTSRPPDSASPESSAAAVPQGQRPTDGNAPQVEGALKDPPGPGFQRPDVAADRGEDVTVDVSKGRMLVPQLRLADAGVTVAMLVTTTAVGRRR